jgi:hypothetical protein
VAAIDCFLGTTCTSILFYFPFGRLSGSPINTSDIAFYTDVGKLIEII